MNWTKPTTGIYSCIHDLLSKQIVPYLGFHFAKQAAHFFF